MSLLGAVFPSIPGWPWWANMLMNGLVLAFLSWLVTLNQAQRAKLEQKAKQETTPQEAPGP